MRLSALALIAALAITAPASAKPDNARAEVQTLDLAKAAISLRSVQGEGNRTGDAARLFRDALVAGGWSANDIEITAVDDTAFLIATWRGSNPALKPLVISGHLDVVEAKPEDWQRDPFTPVVENGYLFGRGASDMKLSAALATSALIELRRDGYRPKRSIILQFSGDEETTMKTSAIIAERLADSEMVLNIDGGGGTFDEKTGRPLFWSYDGAEKTYADLRLEVTNPGGHSSAPRAENAIVQLATALERVGAYRFKPELNPITKAWFESASRFETDPEIVGAMRAFAANPEDAAAIARLRASPAHVGKIGTTCVPTMVNGGHAINALPQRATANINCRIFPGHLPADIMAELQSMANVPAVKFTDVTGDTAIASPASPLRADFVKAVERAMKKAWPGVPVFPTQASGASDSMWFRAKNIPSYGVSPLFTKDSDDFSHGLNERVELRNIKPGVVHYMSLFSELSK